MPRDRTCGNWPASRQSQGCRQAAGAHRFGSLAERDCGGGRKPQPGAPLRHRMAQVPRRGGDAFDGLLAADVSANQRVVGLGGPQKVVRLMRTADGATEAEIRKHTDWITAVDFSPNDRMLVTGDRAGNAFLWETRGAREDAVLKTHGAAPRPPSSSNAGRASWSSKKHAGADRHCPVSSRSRSGRVVGKFRDSESRRLLHGRGCHSITTVR